MLIRKGKHFKGLPNADKQHGDRSQKRTVVPVSNNRSREKKARENPG